MSPAVLIDLSPEERSVLALKGPEMVKNTNPPHRRASTPDVNVAARVFCGLQIVRGAKVGEARRFTSLPRC